MVKILPMQECRVEKMVVRDGRLQAGCDFECGIRVVLGNGLGFGKEKLLAAASPEEQNAWGGALLACRKGVFQVPSQPYTPHPTFPWREAGLPKHALACRKRVLEMHS